ncbi:hypothetical protein B9D92_12810 [Mycobacterium tuberculosis]|nr:hypothetical protein B9D92_12810 [Mycobacterium tuberculosis]
MSEDDIARRLLDSGVADPDAVLRALRLETEWPARQLVDDRWVWLPTLLAGRVFTHRLGADEAVHDMLGVTPDLDPITTLCEHEEYGRLADGSAARIVLAGYDEELLERRGIPDEAIDPGGALLLEPGTLATLGAAAGDLVGVRLTAAGWCSSGSAQPVRTPPSAPGWPSWSTPTSPRSSPRRSGRRASTTRRHLPSQWHRCARSSTSTASRTKTTG